LSFPAICSCSDKGSSAVFCPPPKKSQAAPPRTQSEARITAGFRAFCISTFLSSGFTAVQNLITFPYYYGCAFLLIPLTDAGTPPETAKAASKSSEGGPLSLRLSEKH
jgi:hypothetical protein